MHRVSTGTFSFFDPGNNRSECGGVENEQGSEGIEEEKIEEVPFYRNPDCDYRMTAEDSTTADIVQCKGEIFDADNVGSAATRVESGPININESRSEVFLKCKR